MKHTLLVIGCFPVYISKCIMMMEPNVLGIAWFTESNQSELYFKDFKVHFEGEVQEPRSDLS